MFRRIRFNTQERAISVDFNRLQAMAARGFNETMRHLLLIGTSEPNLGLYAEPLSLTNPVAHEILRGLMVRPAVGSFNLTVDPGVAFFIDPAAAGYEDSVAIPIRTQGVSFPTPLVITTNTSGQTRFDVIECRVSTTPATITDSRDQFDPASGLFVAVAMTKEVEQRLDFRVRAGVPGAGFPGTAEGWAPLTVALVPTGATSNDACTFWDVRRLAEDHVVAPFNVNTAPSFDELNGSLDRVSSTSWILAGNYRGSYGGRRVGGKLRRGSPGTDAESVDLFATGNKDSAVTEPVSTTTNYYAYLLLPFGLPRWSRYTDATSGLRVPREPKGIPVLTTTPPLPDGTPSAPISLANIFGAGATTSDGIFLCYSRNNGGNGNALSCVFFNGKQQLLGAMTQNTGTAVTGVFGGGVGAFTWPALRVPQNAKAIWIRFSAQWTGLTADTVGFNTSLRVWPSRAGIIGGDQGAYDQRDQEFDCGGYALGRNGTLVGIQTPYLRIPLPPSLPGAPRVDPLVINAVMTNAPSQVTASYLGFEF